MIASKRARARRIAGSVMGWMLGLVSAQAQMATPLHVGAITVISNEFGAILPGTLQAPGSLVMVLWASNSIIYAPATNGDPHPNNPILEHGLTAIGASTAPELSAPGNFATSIDEPRPNDGAHLFVRIFNRSTLAASSFYADSQLLTVSGNSVLIAQLGATTNALDTADPDGDGLNNSWEKSYGSSPTNTDTDGDGLGDALEVAIGSSPALADTDGDSVMDGHEVRAGTDLQDPASYLGLADLSPTQPNLLIRWASVTGRHYRVQSTEDPLPAGANFSNESDVIDAFPGALTETTLTNALDANGPRVYRVLLVEP